MDYTLTGSIHCEEQDLLMREPKRDGSARESLSGPPKIARCRYLERSDLPVVAGMIRCQTVETFSEAALNPRIIYEFACLSLVLENELDEIVAAIMLCNYPNILSIGRDEWVRWFTKTYDVMMSKETNTMFVHLLVWDDAYEDTFLNQLLLSVFYTATYCIYVVIVLPPDVSIADCLKRQMTKYTPKTVDKDVNAQVLYVGDQNRVIPDLKFRLAVEEDNDDVVEILDKSTKCLKDFYGEFYVSEMMRRPEHSRRLVVGERSTNNIGAVACLNRRLNVRLITEIFDLEAFGSLRKPQDTLSLRLKVPETASLWSASNRQHDSDDLGEDMEGVAVSKAKTLVSKSVTKSQVSIMDSYKQPSNCGLEDCECETEKGWSMDEPSESDAFAIELLAYQNPADDFRSRTLLRACFECFPDLDQCIILVPTERPHVPYLDFFTRVPLRADKEYPMAMFITHRVFFQGIIAVRKAGPKHMSGIEALLEGVFNEDLMLAEYNRILFSEVELEDEAVYILTCDDVVVGAAIVCDETEVNKLRLGYRVEDLAPRLQPELAQFDRSARITRLSLMPIFIVRLNFFLGEIIRLGDYRNLFYRAFGTTAVSPVISEMTAVRPRLSKWPHTQKYFRKDHEDGIFKEPFALYITSPSMALQRKDLVTTRIVVIGASECGMAFIDTLTLGYKYPYLQFHDVTLVSTDGHPFASTRDYETRLMIPFRGVYCKAYQDLVPSRTNYHVVEGHVVKIDRQEQVVHIEDSGILTYDYLVITTGLQYSKPELKNQKNKLNYMNLVDDSPPCNCFGINTDADADDILSKLEEMTEGFKTPRAIIFHGSSIECYSMLGALLELGLDGSWVKLIEPRRHDGEDAFRDDPQIKEMVTQLIESSGVEVFSRCDLLDLRIDGMDVVSVTVDTEMDGPVEIACDALLSFQIRRPCAKTLHAASQAGLVTCAGRLVIDEEFRTNDRRVYAAGTFTKYSARLRRLGCPEPRHCDSREIGEKLAEKLVKVIVSRYALPRTGDEQQLRLPERLSQVVETECAFEKPIVTAAFLPGGYRYLLVRKPGAPQAADTAAGDSVVTAGGTTMTTGSADTGYFRIHVDQFHYVDGLACFSKADFEIQDVISLYGKHEAILGEIRAGYMNSEIDDFFTYFSQPWTAALFSDDFDDFLKTRRADDQYNLIGCEMTMRAKLKELVASHQHDLTQMSEADREKIIAECMESACYLGGIEDDVTEFVERHEDELPMYWTLGRERYIQREIEDAPLLLGMTRPESEDTQSSRDCSCSDCTGI